MLPSCSALPAKAESKVSYAEAKKAFSRSITSTVEGGFSFSVDSGVFKTVNSLGEERNVFSFAGAQGISAMSGKSIHTLSTDIYAPLTYNGRSRTVEAAIIDDVFYFSLSNPDNEKTNVAYKASIKQEDYLDEDGSFIIDDPTGGILTYEYGSLDWIISDILECLSDEDKAISMSTSLFSDVHLDNFVSAWESLEERTLSNGDNYFVLSFVQDGVSYSLGLEGDKDFTWTGIDFPAKKGDGSQGYQQLGSSEENKDSKLLQLSVDIKASKVKPEFKVENPNAYLELSDSLSLFKKFATAIGKKKFGVDASLRAFHHEDAVEEEDTINHEEVNESLGIEASAFIDMGGNKVNAVTAGVDIVDTLNSEQRKSIHVYGGDNDSAYQGRFFLNVNDILKAQTNKTVLDAMVANLKDVSSSMEESQALSGLVSLGGYLGDGIKAITDSGLIGGIKNNVYSSALDLFDSVEVKDNSIIAVLDLSPVGLEGKATLTINDVTSSGPIAVVSLGEGVSFANSSEQESLSLSGSIALYPYIPEKEKTLSAEEKAEYSVMTHMEGFSEQIGKFASSTKMVLDVNGSISYEGKYERSYSNSLQGFDLNGRFGVDLRNAAGAGKATFVDKKEQYRNDHNVKIDVEGPASKGEGDASKSIANANSMIFEYNSVNANVSSTNKLSDYDDGYTVVDGEGGVRTQPHNSSSPIKGAFTIYSLNSIIELVKAISGKDDTRFAKFIAGTTSLEGASLLKSINGHAYAPLLSKGILSSAEVSPSKGTFKIASWVMGTYGDILLEVTYGEDEVVIRDDLSRKTIGGGVSSIHLSLKMESKFTDPETEKEISEITDIDFTLAIKSILSTDEEIPWNFKGIDKSSLTDYSSLYQFADFAIGSAFLGVTQTNKVSTYRVSGKANISFSFISLGTAEFDAYIHLKGSEVNFYIDLKVPTKRELFSGYGNYPKTTLSGYWTEKLYGHISGKKSTNYIYFTRSSDKYKDAAMATSDDFIGNADSFILRGVLGLNNKTMNQINSSQEKSKAASIHGEDLITSYSYADSSTDPKWNIGVGLNTLLHKDIFDPFVATIGGKVLNNGEKTIYSISGNTKVVGILKLSLDATLSNVSSGSYQECWSGTAYDAYNGTFYNQETKTFLIDPSSAVTKWSQNW